MAAINKKKKYKNKVFGVWNNFDLYQPNDSLDKVLIDFFTTKEIPDFVKRRFDDSSKKPKWV